MFNDHRSEKEARHYIQERAQEVETYSTLQRLGYGDSAAARRIFVLIIVIAVVGISLLL